MVIPRCGTQALAGRKIAEKSYLRLDSLLLWLITGDQTEKTPTSKLETGNWKLEIRAEYEMACWRWQH